MNSDSRRRTPAGCRRFLVGENRSFCSRFGSSARAAIVGGGSMPVLAPQMRGKLAKSAFELFAQRGIKNVSLDEVAAHAGVTKGSLYWHYKSKKEVILAAAAYYYRRWQKRRMPRSPGTTIRSDSWSGCSVSGCKAACSIATTASLPPKSSPFRCKTRRFAQLGTILRYRAQAGRGVGSGRQR